MLPWSPWRGLALDLWAANVLTCRAFFAPEQTGLLEAFNSPTRMEDVNRIEELCILLESNVSTGFHRYLY